MGKDLCLWLIGPKPGVSILRIFFAKSFPLYQGLVGFAMHAHGVHKSGFFFFLIKSHSCCKSAESSQRHTVPLGSVIDRASSGPGHRSYHTQDPQNNHTILIRPASERRTEQATIVHLLFSNFYRQRCFHISSSMFIEENAQVTQVGKGLSNSRGRGRDVCPINPCGLTLTLRTGPKVVLTSLQTDKIHLRGL